MKQSRLTNCLVAAARGLMLTGTLLLAVCCASRTGGGKQENDNAAAFARVKPVLERNCVHCHSVNRLPGMPSMTDTKALASLIGPGKLIVPGKPEQSRFYLVTTLSDEQASAMPPTGHAMSRNEVTVLREWIQGGAELPDNIIKFNPVGVSPRSR